MDSIPEVFKTGSCLQVNMIPHQNYFEGILQLRTPTKEIVAFIMDMVDQKDGVAITKVIKHRDGADYYFTSQKYLQVVGKKLKENFPGEYKMTSTLHTRDSQQNKDLYRITVFFRCLPFRVGEIINYRGEEYKIISMSDKITAKHLVTGKQSFLDINRLG